MDQPTLKVQRNVTKALEAKRNELGLLVAQTNNLYITQTELHNNTLKKLCQAEQYWKY